MTPLEGAIHYFTEEIKALACMSIACGTAETAFTAQGGVVDEAGTPVQPTHLFDLASLTKLFTALTVYRLRDEGLLALDQPVTRYAPRFTRLGQVTVGQVLGFEVAILTPERVDAQGDRASALKTLFSAEIAENGPRAYSDMHAMVLKYVIEGAAGEGFYDVLRQKLLSPIGMTHTFAHVPLYLRRLCVSCDREHRIEGERYILREGVQQGMPHDPKARMLSPDGRDLCGHAGLFSTRGDMILLCQAILRGAVLSGDSLRDMARNRTGHPLAMGGYSQYLGAQCYVRHPEPYYSEVPCYMGQRAIGLSGFTGNHLSLDPERGVFALYLGNRVLNRLSTLIPPSGKTWQDYGLSAEGVGSVTWPDGSRVFSSVNYVHQKDAHFHPAVMRTLGVEAV